jgi:hypothetical protein
VTQGERALLIAWLKQGRGWLMSQVRPGLVLQIFFPKFENNFEAGSSVVKACDVFGSRLPLGKLPTPALEKSHLKSFLDFGKEIYETKLALPNNW